MNSISFQLDEVLNVLESIKQAGNLFFKSGAYAEACRKYKKSVRYFNFFEDKLLASLRSQMDDEQVAEKLAPFHALNIATCLNIAASELELSGFANAKNACDEVLLNDKLNAKAFYRRGQAHIGLKNYDDALVDLEQASRLLPNDKNIAAKLQQAKEIWRNYEDQQRDVYKNLFK